MAKYYMEDEEIRRDYLRAKDREKQLEILADMNLVDKATMRNKIKEMGLLEETQAESAKPKARRAVDKIDEEEARRLVEKNVSEEQIAKHFGVGISTFRSWRREKGIYRHSQAKTAADTGKEAKKVADQKPTKTQAEEKQEEADGLTVERMASLFAMLDRLHDNVRVTAGGKLIRGIKVNMRFGGGSDDKPESMTVELET